MVTTVGVHTKYFEADLSSLSISRTDGSNNDVTITNISVKKVGQDWDLETGWSIGEDKAVVTNAPNLYQRLTQSSLSFTLNSTYKISITCSEYSTGFVYLRKPRGVESDTTLRIDNVGTFVFYVKALSDLDAFALAVGAIGTDLSISNISVKEITDSTNIPRINYEGFSYQDSLGSELVVNGDFSVDSDWSKDSNWSISNGSASADGTSNNNISQSSVIPTIGKTYKITFEVLTISQGYFQARLGNELGVQANNVGVYTSYVTATTNDRIRIYGKSLAIGSIDNVSVKEVTGQEVVPDSGCGSYLLEPQSTNLITYSEDFSNSYWTKSSVTLTSGFTSPDGSNNAYKVEGTIGTSYLANLTVNTHLRSIYVRTVSGTGQVKLLGNSTLYDVTEQWTRVSFNPTSDTYQFAVDFRGGTNISEVLIWGAQVENLSYATSYIPTNGAANTRLQDIANNSGNSSLINSTSGVLYAEIAALANDGTSREISINNGTTTDRVQILLAPTSNQILIFYKAQNGATQFTMTETLTDATQFNKIAFKWKANDFALWVNGTETDTISSGVTSNANALTKIDFDQFNQAAKFFGKNKALAVYKEALTDANLRCLTYPPAVATTFDLDFDTIAEQFTFTRGSEATFVNAQGLIQSTNQIGPELVTNGDFATDSDWIKGNGTTISGGQANLDGIFIW